MWGAARQRAVCTSGAALAVLRPVHAAIHGMHRAAILEAAVPCANNHAAGQQQDRACSRVGATLAGGCCIFILSSGKAFATLRC